MIFSVPRKFAHLDGHHLSSCGVRHETITAGVCTRPPVARPEVVFQRVLNVLSVWAFAGRVGFDFLCKSSLPYKILMLFGSLSAVANIKFYLYHVGFIQNGGTPGDYFVFIMFIRGYSCSSSCQSGGF